MSAEPAATADAQLVDAIARRVVELLEEAAHVPTRHVRPLKPEAPA